VPNVPFGTRCHFHTAHRIGVGLVDYSGFAGWRSVCVAGVLRLVSVDMAAVAMSVVPVFVVPVFDHRRLL
jgi:hypothetical protein